MFGKVIVEDIMARVIGQIFRLPKAGLPVTIVQIAGLPNEVVNAVVSVLARMAFEVALWSRGPYRIAWCAKRRIATSPPTPRKASSRPGAPSAASPRKVANTAFRSASSPSARRNSTRPCFRNVRRCLRCGSATSATRTSSRAASGVSADGVISFLSSIADREAIAFGEAIATPMRMKFGDYREFETKRSQWRERPREDTIQARAELRMIVARLRNEIPNETVSAQTY